jgi:hypothetical protein
LKTNGYYESDSEQHGPHGNALLVAQARAGLQATNFCILESPDPNRYDAIELLFCGFFWIGGWEKIYKADIRTVTANVDFGGKAGLHRT